MDLKELIKLNYDAVVARGLINELTSDNIFYLKAKEELIEVKDAIYYGDSDDRDKEWIDLLTVCFNRLTHFGCDIERLLKENADKNIERAKKAKASNQKVDKISK